MSLQAKSDEFASRLSSLNGMGYGITPPPPAIGMG